MMCGRTTPCSSFHAIQILIKLIIMKYGLSTKIGVAFCFQTLETKNDNFAHSKLVYTLPMVETVSLDNSQMT